MSDKAHPVQLNDKDVWVKYKEWFQEDEPSLEVKKKWFSWTGLFIFIFFWKSSMDIFSGANSELTELIEDGFSIFLDWSQECFFSPQNFLNEETYGLETTFFHTSSFDANIFHFWGGFPHIFHKVGGEGDNPSPVSCVLNLCSEMFI